MQNPNSPASMEGNSHDDHVSRAKKVLSIEATGINGIADALDGEFSAAIEHVLQCKGRVVVCGMGKSGLIGKKITATLASTGTPSLFLHPGEAFHGDLGMVTSEDVVLAISYSGETEEVTRLIPFFASNRNVLIAITGSASSSLAKAARWHLDISVPQEACPLQLAPTASTTACLALGDAIAVTLMQARGFQPEHFAKYHPGGSLGRRLLHVVDDEMARSNLPIVSPSSVSAEVVQVMTKCRLGVAIVELDSEGEYGLITDGDLRRGLERFQNEFMSVTAADLMSSHPCTVPSGTKVGDALDLMTEKQITTLLVTEERRLLGVFKK